MIIASAIKLSDGRVFVGERHNDCFRNLISISISSGMTSEQARKLHFGCIQGFITDSLKFLDREQAFFEAGRCNQIKADPTEPCLMSEDLW